MKRIETEDTLDFECENGKEQHQVKKACQLLDDGWLYYGVKSEFFSAASSALGQLPGLTLPQWSFITDCLRAAGTLKAAFRASENGSMRDVECCLRYLHYYCASKHLDLEKELIRICRECLLSPDHLPLLNDHLKKVCDEHELQIKEVLEFYRKLARICVKLIPNDKFFKKAAHGAGVK